MAIIVISVNFLYLSGFMKEVYGQLDNSTSIPQNMTIPQNVTIPQNMTIQVNMTIPQNVTIPVNVTDWYEDTLDIIKPEPKNYLYTITSMSGIDIGTMEHVLTESDEIDGEITFRWEKQDNVIINSVDFGEFNGWVSLPTFPYELDNDDAVLDYKLSLPFDVCSAGMFDECIEETNYKIPVVIRGVADGKKFTVDTDIVVEVTSFEYGDLLFFLIIPLFIVIIIVLSRKRKRKSNFYKDLVKYR